MNNDPKILSLKKDMFPQIYPKIKKKVFPLQDKGLFTFLEFNLEDPLENKMLDLKGFILELMFEINK